MSGTQHAGGLHPSQQQQREFFSDRPWRILLRWAMVFTAYVTVFATGGLVPFEDIFFTVFTVFYIFIISHLVFPNRSGKRATDYFKWGKRLGLLKAYMNVAAVVGVVLPVLYILGSYATEDRTPVASATPHFFLLISQILCEMVGNTAALSLPTNAAIPISFNARRLSTLYTWCQVEFARRYIEGSDVYTCTWLWFGRVLAVSNMALWSFNLLCFLLPFYLPMVGSLYWGPGSESFNVSTTSAASATTTGAQDDQATEAKGSAKKLN